MAYAAWGGALELKLNGIPVPINVKFTNRVSPLRNQGLKLCAPDGQAVGQYYLTADGSWRGTIGECSRAAEVSKGVLVKLSDEVVKAMGEAERDSYVEPNSFAPLSSIDLALTDTPMDVVPDTSVAGADRSCAIVWNGLRTTGLAYITQIVMRAGSVDRIVAIYADEHGLRAVTLPFASQVAAEPECPFDINDDIGAIFAAAIENEYAVRAYAADEHPSAHAERRAKLLEQALAGEQIEVTAPVKAKADGPDLLALLTASVQQSKKGKATKTSKAKVAA